LSILLNLYQLSRLKDTGGKVRVLGTVLWAFLGPWLPTPALAQALPETVTWSVAPAAAKPGESLKLTVNGAVLEGWHVYSLKQAPEGPTPLLARVEDNAAAAADGAVSESKPVKLRDPAFGLDTQFYERAFTLTVPVRLKRGLKPGAQAIPVSVRFQTCNGRICQPPKTVHLNAIINPRG
jgi:thiol:disulfide interchange protein DsbD